MTTRRRHTLLTWLAATLLGGAALVFAALPRVGARPSAPAARGQERAWAAANLPGSVKLAGEVPLSVSGRAALYVRPLPASIPLQLNFGFPLTDAAALNGLIGREARAHDYISRAQLYARFSPPPAQVGALASWLRRHGFRITHVGGDRLSLGAQAPAGVVERALHVRIDEYRRGASTVDGAKVGPYAFYASTQDPTVPARFGLQTVSGLSSVDRFYTDAQLAAARAHGGALQADSPARGDGAASVRTSGYFPSDIRSMYDVPAGWNGAGETIGFTLWGAGETQAAMTEFASATGDQPITVLTPCSATGNSPTTPSSCADTQVGADELLTVLESGNANEDFAANDETALDIEQAHGIATHAGMKYYEADCSASPPAGSGDSATGCNGSDVGLEDAVEDAASDPTLHVVSNSWLYEGDPERGAGDPFMLATQNSFMLAAAAGTTFYFASGDSGTYLSGYPADSPYVAAVGGTALYSTSDPAQLSTEDAWSAGGSWCSGIFPRPAWQTGPGVTANADCPGRAIPDVAAIADTETPVHEVYSTSSDTTSDGSVGGTSVATPVWAGLTAVLENFVAAQSYPGGAAPAIGFTPPVIYQLGDADQNAYFRDVVCGNTAGPPGSPDGDAALPGWDQATGWGAPDFLHLATGYAIALGATDLTAPASLSPGYAWACARTPSNATEDAISFPSSTVGYAVGAPGTSWYAQFLPDASWPSEDTILKTTDGGQTWAPTNADVTSISCTSASHCVEVGDGGVIRTTSDAGSTWASVPSGFNKALTQVSCPSAAVCYAAGDRGFVLKSTDGGQTWADLSSTDGNPIYGLYCASITTCYATDIYAHILKTTDGGNTWTWQATPVTTPGVGVAGSGGPNPFAGLFGISCVDAAGQECVAVGGFPPTGTTAPIVVTTDGGATWTSAPVSAPANDWLAAVSCLPATTTCFAVGRGGDIETTSDMVDWSQMTSGTTEMLNDITCQSTTSCVAVGQDGTIDVLSGATWTASTNHAGGAFLAAVSCLTATDCYAAGSAGVTIATADGASWTQQAGGGIAVQTNSIACPSTSTCVAVGNPVGPAGSVETTSDGGGEWVAQTVPTFQNLDGVSCASTASCVAVGASGTIVFENGAGGWQAASSGTSALLRGVACAGSDCTAVGDGGTIVGSSDGGQSWAAETSNTAARLDAVACPAAGVCFASGAVPNVAANSVVLATTDGGATWSSQNSATRQQLFGIACLDASNCFAGGAGGTIVTTNSAGATWTQQGNPLSGPLSALNASSIAGLTINGVACAPTTCAMATGSSGDIMTSPLLTVTVNATQTDPLAVGVSGLPASSAAIGYSPSGEAPAVTGTLTCSTPATTASPEGTYPITDCGGLAAAGYSVVYDYGASTYTVIYPPTSTSTTTTTSSTSSGTGSTSTTTSTTTSTVGSTSTTTGTTTSTVGTTSTTTSAVSSTSAASSTAGISCLCGEAPTILSLSIGSSTLSFAAFSPGVSATYNATTQATITEVVPGGGATLMAADLSATFPGHLVDDAAGGSHEMAQGLEVAVGDPPGTTGSGSGAFSDLSRVNPAPLLTFAQPVSADAVSITFEQPVAATDPLDAGSYSKTIALTLSSATL